MSPVFCLPRRTSDRIVLLEVIDKNLLMKEWILTYFFKQFKRGLCVKVVRRGFHTVHVDLYWVSKEFSLT